MDRYSKAISRATRWARSGVDGFRGTARYAMAVLIWSAAVLWIAALMVVATGSLLTDAAKSGRTTLALKHRVSNAERAHRGAIREAEAELSRCQTAYDREVAAAKQHLDALYDANGKPRQPARRARQRRAGGQGRGLPSPRAPAHVRPNATRRHRGVGPVGESKCRRTDQPETPTRHRSRSRGRK